MNSSENTSSDPAQGHDGAVPAQPHPELAATVLRAAGLAKAWTGAHTGAIVLSALALIASTSGLVSLGAEAIVLDALTLVTAVGGWILLCAWMIAVRDVLAARGAAVPETWKIWVPWLIPIYAWFGPFLAMRALTSHVEGLRQVRARWWAGFVLSNVMWFQASLFASTALATMGLTFSAVAIVTSYLALRTLIDRTTDSLSTGPLSAG